MQQEPETAALLPAELLATVGHEFRGPLTTIQGYATTLLRSEQQLRAEERREYLLAISEASTHLSKLVDRFLELGKLETHTHAFRPESVNLLALAQETLLALQKKQSHHLLLLPVQPGQHSSTSSRDAETRPDALMVAGDRRLLRTMLDILLENAVAYSAPESLITVSLEPMSPAAALAAFHAASETGKHQELILPARFHEQEALLALHVKDHGMGIEPAHLALIFRRFYRVDTSLTREVNGLGIGLTLCQAIVALHRGMLWVESAVGEGSTFSLVLPQETTLEQDAGVEG
jgi:signal transduction histidine kinase